MDKRPLLLAGGLAAGLLVALLASASCWGRKADGVQPRADHAAPALTPASTSAASPLTAAPTGERPAPAAEEAKPAESITTGTPGIGRTVVAADGLSGTAPAPTVGKPVAPVDVAWTLARDPAQPTAWVVAVTLTPKSGGQRLVATFTARAGAEVLNGASATIADPQPGHAYLVETVVAVQGPANLVLGVSLQGSDERGRTITIPLPPPAGAAGGPPPRSAIPASAVPASATPRPESGTPANAAASGGVIHGEGVILQPSR